MYTATLSLFCISTAECDSNTHERFSPISLFKLILLQTDISKLPIFIMIKVIILYGFTCTHKNDNYNNW